jgi:hypothetical protein
MAKMQKSTRQLLVKVPDVPCLYRHNLNGIYYGIKRTSGKRKEHSLRTTDPKLAERKFKYWTADLELMLTQAQPLGKNGQDR